MDVNRRVFFCGIIPLLAEGNLERALIGQAASLVSIVVYREVLPFRVRFASGLSYGAQIVIFIVYSAAVVIESGAGDKIDQTLFGALLCLGTLAILAAAAVASFQRQSVKKRAIAWKQERMLTKVELACHFSRTKFASTFDTVREQNVPPSHCLAYCYDTLKKVQHMVRRGVPVGSGGADDDGIIVSLNQPHDLSDAEKLIFTHREALVALVLPRSILVPSPSSAEGIFSVPRSVLEAMRGSFAGDLVDPTLWHQGTPILLPQCIARAFQLEDSGVPGRDEDDVKGKRLSTVVTAVSQLEKWKKAAKRKMGDGKKAPDEEAANNEVEAVKVVSVPASCSAYLDAMDAIRAHCEGRGWLPLYHYTVPFVAPFILESGLRMSTQGQGDGGVYFSTLGPASYDLSTPEYEANIITDCFGKERLDEYRGKHKLDVCLVYGAEPRILSQARGGRDNAKMVGKRMFEDFSLPHADGNYFLRPDRILGAFLLDPTKALGGHHEASARMEEEKGKDQIVKESLKNEEVQKGNKKAAEVGGRGQSADRPPPGNETKGTRRNKKSAKVQQEEWESSTWSSKDDMSMAGDV